MKKLKNSGDYIDFIAENSDVAKVLLIQLSNQAKKEVFTEVNIILNKWNRQGDSKIEITINTIQKRINDLEKHHLPKTNHKLKMTEKK